MQVTYKLSFVVFFSEVAHYQNLLFIVVSTHFVFHLKLFGKPVCLLFYVRTRFESTLHSCLFPAFNVTW